jgi:hypothetical protein
MRTADSFAWPPIAIAAALWPIAITLPNGLATPQENDLAASLQALGLACVILAIVAWLVLLLFSLYRWFWRFAGSLMTALVVFFTVGFLGAHLL